MMGLQEMLNAGSAQLGKPYVFNTPLDLGNPNPKTFDCSGLTGWMYNLAGIKIPHQSQQQYNMGTKVPYAQLGPGDLVYWGNGRSATSIHHVAMYYGGNKCLQAPQPGESVEWRTISPGESELIPYGTRFPGPGGGMSAVEGIGNVLQVNPLVNPFDAASDAYGVIKGVGGIVGKLSEASLWKRIGLGLLGALILIVAVFYIMET